VTKEAAMAKMTATETAQQVIDAAVQMFGGLGVVSEQPVERLYREIRALRIYEGATEVQQLIIARELLRDGAATIRRGEHAWIFFNRGLGASARLRNGIAARAAWCS
jgi:pantothenate synthetase